MHGVQDFIGMKIGRMERLCLTKYQVNEAYPDKTDFYGRMQQGMIKQR
jgi:hypothetical protein